MIGVTHSGTTNITVEMSLSDAMLFRTFREHQDSFSMLLAANVFKMDTGNATLHFNQGKLKRVDFLNIVYF